MGQQWADDVHAARAAQEQLRTSLVGGGGSREDVAADVTDPRARTATSSPGAENCPPPLDRAPTEVVVGQAWAQEVQAARCAQAALESDLVAKGSPAGAHP